MTSGAKFGDSDFEPDSSFFDSFLDGMDVLIDSSAEKKSDSSCRSEDEGEGKLVIDLGSSPEPKSPPMSNRGVDKASTAALEEIQATLTNRILAHLEKSHASPKINAFSTSPLAIDVLDRLKNCVAVAQNKPKPPCLNVTSRKHASSPAGDNGDDLLASSSKTKTTTFSARAPQDDISDESDAGSSITDECRTTMDQFIQWLCRKNAKRKREKSKKRSKPLDKKETAHTATRSKTSKDKYPKHKYSRRKRRRESGANDTYSNLDLNLESVSSAEDDILNRMSEEELETPQRQPSGNSGKLLPRLTKLDREDGEVLSSSASDDDYKRDRRGKKYKAYFRGRSSNCFRFRSTSPQMDVDLPRTRRYLAHRSPSPSPAHREKYNMCRYDKSPPSCTMSPWSPRYRYHEAQRPRSMSPPPPWLSHRKYLRPTRLECAGETERCSHRQYALKRCLSPEREHSLEKETRIPDNRSLHPRIPFDDRASPVYPPYVRNTQAELRENCQMIANKSVGNEPQDSSPLSAGRLEFAFGSISTPDPCYSDSSSDAKPPQRKLSLLEGGPTSPTGTRRTRTVGTNTSVSYNSVGSQTDTDKLGQITTRENKRENYSFRTVKPSLSLYSREKLKELPMCGSSGISDFAGVSRLETKAMPSPMDLSGESTSTTVFLSPSQRTVETLSFRCTSC